MAKKDKYKGPTPEEMDRTARMIEANIPPGSSSKLKNTNPMQDMLEGAMAAEEAAKERAAMEKAMLQGARMGGMGQMQGMKKGGKVKKMASGGKVSQLAKANGCAIKGKTKGRMV
jgi:hypothetical protein